MQHFYIENADIHRIGTKPNDHNFIAIDLQSYYTNEDGIDCKQFAGRIYVSACCEIYIGTEETHIYYQG